MEADLLEVLLRDRLAEALQDEGRHEGVMEMMEHLVDRRREGVTEGWAIAILALLTRILILRRAHVIRVRVRRLIFDLHSGSEIV